MTGYTTWGSVRGDCGHLHRTYQAAQRCLEQDRRGCRGQDGYSDRHIRVSTARELAGYITTYGPGVRYLCL